MGFGSPSGRSRKLRMGTPRSPRHRSASGACRGPRDRIRRSLRPGSRPRWPARSRSSSCPSERRAGAPRAPDAGMPPLSSSGVGPPEVAPRSPSDPGLSSSPAPPNVDAGALALFDASSRESCRDEFARRVPHTRSVSPEGPSRRWRVECEASGHSTQSVCVRGHPDGRDAMSLWRHDDACDRQPIVARYTITTSTPSAVRSCRVRAQASGASRRHRATVSDATTTRPCPLQMPRCRRRERSVGEFRSSFTARLVVSFIGVNRCKRGAASVRVRVLPERLRALSGLHDPGPEAGATGAPPAIPVGSFFPYPAAFPGGVFVGGAP
jgi:hypothetical protein